MPIDRAMTRHVIQVSEAEGGAMGLLRLWKCAEMSNEPPKRTEGGAVRGCSSYLKIR